MLHGSLFMDGTRCWTSLRASELSAALIHQRSWRFPLPTTCLLAWRPWRQGTSPRCNRGSSRHARDSGRPASSSRLQRVIQWNPAAVLHTQIQPTKHPQIADSGRDLTGSPVVAGELRARFRICCSPRPVLSHPRSTRFADAFLTKRQRPLDNFVKLGPLFDSRQVCSFIKCNWDLMFAKFLSLRVFLKKKRRQT